MYYILLEGSRIKTIRYFLLINPMNFDELTKYLSYLDIISLVIGFILIGGAIAIPDLNKLTQELLNQHLAYLILLLGISIGAIFISIATGNIDDSLAFFHKTFFMLFTFSIFILISILATIFFTTNANWPLILGLTLILNYLFTHYIKL